MQARKAATGAKPMQAGTNRRPHSWSGAAQTSACVFKSACALAMLQSVVCKCDGRTGSPGACRSAGEVEGRRATQEVSTAGDTGSAQVDATAGDITPCASDIVAEAIRHAVHNPPTGLPRHAGPHVSTQAGTLAVSWHEAGNDMVICRSRDAFLAKCSMPSPAEAPSIADACEMAAVIVEQASTQLSRCARAHQPANPALKPKSSTSLGHL